MEKSISENLKETIKLMSPEELQKLWKQLEPFNNTGPLAEEFIKEIEKINQNVKKIKNKNVNI